MVRAPKCVGTVVSWRPADMRNFAGRAHPPATGWARNAAPRLLGKARKCFPSASAGCLKMRWYGCLVAPRRHARIFWEGEGGRMGRLGNRFLSPKMRWYGCLVAPRRHARIFWEGAGEEDGEARKSLPRCPKMRWYGCPVAPRVHAIFHFPFGHSRTPRGACLRSPSGRVGIYFRIPFGDHPLKLERYRED